MLSWLKIWTSNFLSQNIVTSWSTDHHFSSPFHLIWTYNFCQWARPITETSVLLNSCNREICGIWAPARIVNDTPEYATVWSKRFMLISGLQIHKGTQRNLQTLKGACRHCDRLCMGSRLQKWGESGIFRERCCSGMRHSMSFSERRHGGRRVSTAENLIGFE